LAVWQLNAFRGAPGTVLELNAQANKQLAGVASRGSISPKYGGKTLIANNDLAYAA